MELFLKLDLDGLEVWNYCPGHSKTNPAEMPNRTVQQFRGRTLESDNDRGYWMLREKERSTQRIGWKRIQRRTSFSDGEIVMMPRLQRIQSMRKRCKSWSVTFHSTAFMVLLSQSAWLLWGQQWAGAAVWLLRRTFTTRGDDSINWRLTNTTCDEQQHVSLHSYTQQGV